MRLLAEMAAKRVEEQRTGFSVVLFHKSKMPGVMPILDETREDKLLQRGSMEVRQPLCRAHLFDQRRRHHDESDAQRGKEGHAECADIDHPGRQESLEGTDGRRVVAEVPVAVLLHHKRRVLPRVAEEPYASLDRHCPAQGKLVRGCDVDKARPGSLWQLISHETLLVSRHGDDPPAHAGNDPAAVSRSWIFHYTVRTPAPKEHSCGNVQSLCRAACDHNLLRLASHAAAGRKVPRNLPPQLCPSLRLAVGKIEGRHLVPYLARDPLPEPGRKSAEIRHARAEIDKIEPEGHELAGRGGGEILFSGGPQYRAGSHAKGAPGARREIAFRNELIKGLLCSRARSVHLPRNLRRRAQR